MIPVPPGVKVEHIDPPVVDLVWEDRVVVDVPVEIGIVGAAASGFVVKSAPTAAPAFVHARGPKSQVMVLQHARADAFDVTGLAAGQYTRQLAVDRPPRAFPTTCRACRPRSKSCVNWSTGSLLAYRLPWSVT